MPEARAEFASARDRVRALATLHRHLYSHGEVHTINMPDFLTELCGQLFQAMGEIEGQRIKLTIEASPLQMSSDQAVPLSLIVTEAVSNALKYAFPHGRAGHVLVRLTADGETVTLVVQDDGIGMPLGMSESEHGRARRHRHHLDPWIRPPARGRINGGGGSRHPLHPAHDVAARCG